MLKESLAEERSVLEAEPALPDPFAQDATAPAVAAADDASSEAGEGAEAEDAVQPLRPPTDS